MRISECGCLSFVMCDWYVVLFCLCVIAQRKHGSGSEDEEERPVKKDKKEKKKKEKKEKKEKKAKKEKKVRVCGCTLECL